MHTLTISLPIGYIYFETMPGRFQQVEQPTGLVFLRENDLKVIFKNVGFWEVDFAEDERFCAEVEEVFRRVRLGEIWGVVGRGEW